MGSSPGASTAVRYRLAAIAGAVASAVALAMPDALPASAPETPATNNYIVTYERSVGDVDRETNQQEDAGGFDARLRFRHAIKGFAARLTASQVAELRASPDVASVRVDEPARITGAVPLAAGEPVPPTGVRRIGAANVNTTRQRSDTAVAVLDTGVDLSHPDLNVTDGTNCVTPGEAAEDDHGHGTHVAGVIGAKNDGAGVVGVAPGTRVYAVKVMDVNGRGSESQIICGIEWVTAHAEALNIRVANMSFGKPGSDDGRCGRADGSALHAAICRAVDAGVVPVASAGNDGVDFGAGRGEVPAAYPEVVTVTAMSDLDGEPGARKRRGCDQQDPDDAVASFSNFAVRPEDRAHTVAAPGVCIRSTFPGGQYAAMTGTSAAAPHVAGIAALCFGEAGVAGPCDGRKGAEGVAQFIAELRTTAAGRPATGFTGDALSASAPDRFYGAIARVQPDTAAPETSVEGAAAPAPRPPTFSLSSADAGARFECRIDRGRWTPCKRRFVPTGLEAGSHTLSARAVDAAGNADPSPVTMAFRTPARTSRPVSRRRSGARSR